jgi:hypothetical protein
VYWLFVYLHKLMIQWWGRIYFGDWGERIHPPIKLIEGLKDMCKKVKWNGISIPEVLDSDDGLRLGSAYVQPYSTYLLMMYWENWMRPTSSNAKRSGTMITFCKWSGSRHRRFCRTSGTITKRVGIPFQFPLYGEDNWSGKNCNNINKWRCGGGGCTT